MMGLPVWNTPLGETFLRVTDHPKQAARSLPRASRRSPRVPRRLSSLLLKLGLRGGLPAAPSQNLGASAARHCRNNRERCVCVPALHPSRGGSGPMRRVMGNQIRSARRQPSAPLHASFPRSGCEPARSAGLAARPSKIRYGALRRPPPARLRASFPTGLDAGRWCAPVPGR